jgi:molybdopterin synthase sulfur carrier subunit
MARRQRANASERTIVTTRVASPLRSYTDGRAIVEAEGETVREALADLDLRYPGMRFRMIDEQDRIRPHIRLYVNTDAVEQLGHRIARGDTLHLICALSGG